VRQKTELDPEDREFFSLVAAAIFTNPFSVERAKIEAVVAPGALLEHGSEHLFTALIPALDERFDKLERHGVDTILPFHGEDRQLLEHAFLFHTYHRFVTALDALIETELVHPSTPAEALFADEAIAILRSRGFSDRDALRYFGLFYQLRRAYYFIIRSLVGVSSSMRKLRFALWNNVFTHDARTYDRYLWNRMEDFSTLLLGETGTGKGTAAGAIGRSVYIPFDPVSKRFRHSFTDTFIAINLSEFPESLIESELFGHRKGAFTGAVDNHKGVFELCSPYGSLFLDEIGDASLNVQIKLLRVLQERTFTPVGSHQPLRFSGRVIAATNRPVGDLRKCGKLRDDFFYRLCSDIIIVPPLRERLRESAEELDLLVRSLVERMTGQDRPELTGMVLAILKRDVSPDYPWPGNVRELEQAVRRILLTRRYESDFPAAAMSPDDEFLRQLQAGELDVRTLLGHYCALLYRRFGNFEEVARRTGLDRRTVSKHLRASSSTQ